MNSNLILQKFDLLNFNNIFISPLNYLVAIFFFLGVFKLSLDLKIFQKKKIPLILVYILILTVIVFILNIFLIFKINVNNILPILIIITFYGVKFFLQEKKFLINKIKELHSKNNKFILIFLYLIFFNSLLSPLDIDSLDYHIGFPGFIQNNQYYEINKGWYHSPFFFNGEIINLIGIILKSDIFLNFVNFIAILIIFKIIDDNSKNNLSEKCKYLVLGCPVIIQLILSSKPFLFPLSIIFYSYFLINDQFKSKTYNNYYLIALFCAMFFGCSFRYELYILCFILFFTLIFKYKVYNFKIFSAAGIGVFVSILPIILRNLINYNDPIYPFLSFEILEEGYLNFIKNLGTSENFIFGLDKTTPIPLNLFFSTIPHYFLSTLGFVILIILFQLKKFLNNELLIISFIYFLVLIIIGKHLYPRFFLPSYLLIIFLYGRLKIQSHSNFFKVILISHLIFCCMILIYSITTNGLMLISEKFKNDIYEKRIDNYLIYKKIHENFKEKKFLDLTSSRNHFYKRNINVNFNENFNQLNNEQLLKKIVNKNIFLIIDEKFYNFLLENEVKFKNLKSFKNYKILTRNPLFHNEKNVYLIKLY